ncbi:MAG: oxygen-dependent coproporphyrinogen oxidase [Chloroflexaceae bacterium]|nr:oxygen-dependent coproporphyrinogen oxidase [Chloroflexaceae bacterium]
MRRSQERLCAAFEQQEDALRTAQPHMGQPGRFTGSAWERPGGGGGTPRVLTDGLVFERAGVNVSVVFGEQVPPSIWQTRPATRDKAFFATGISMVLHPRTPYVPAFHANFRYFEVGDDWWFGGGMDMTPTYGFDTDAIHFHRTLKDYCDQHGIVNYAELKRTCDEYFYIKHRHEMRGIGGIFFDMLHPTESEGWEQAYQFVEDGITAIQEAYLPIVERRRLMPYGDRERQWQLYRRGRYVEFNLVYDRGTIFGLQTQGDAEAILMSLPPLARWEYRYQPAPDSPEASTARYVQPMDWASMSDNTDTP